MNIRKFAKCGETWRVQQIRCLDGDVLVMWLWYFMCLTMCEVTCSQKMIDNSLSHRPTLIRKSIVSRKIWNLFHEKCSSSSGTRTHGFCSNVFCLPRYPLARHGGWRALQKLAGFYCYVIELLAMCYMQLAKRLWVWVQVQPIFFYLNV